MTPKTIRTHRLVLVLAVLAIAVFALRNRGNKESAQPLQPAGSAASSQPSAPTPLPLTASAPESNWKTYPADAFGFTLRYPASWVLDSSIMEQYGSIASASKNYSNQFTLYGSASVKSGTADTPLLTITVDTLEGTERGVNANLNSSAQWLEEASSGLPGLANVDTVTVNGHNAAKVTGLSVVRGSYELVYLLDAGNGATAKFDATYANEDQLETMETIVNSFQFTRSLK